LTLRDQIQRNAFGFCGDEATRFISLYISETNHHGSTSFAALREAFHRPQEGVLLVNPLLLKRIIRAHRKLTDLAFNIPRGEEYLLPTPDLVDLIGNIDPTQEKGWREIPTEMCVLLAEPSAEEAAQYAIEHFGMKYWALMAHAELHKRCVALCRSGRLNEAVLKRTIARIGVVEFEGIRDVLASDRRLFDPKDNLEVLLEFLAYWVQVSYFTPELTRQFFPAIKDPERLNELIEQLGIDLLEVVQSSIQPHTPSLVTLLRLKTLKQSAPLEVHQFKFHATRLMRDLGAALEQDAQHEKSLARLEPLVSRLIERFISADRIVRGLRFADLEREVLWGDHSCSAAEMLLLDRLLAVHLGRMYSGARRADLRLFEQDGDAALQHIRDDPQPAQLTDRLVQRLEKYEQSQTAASDPGLIELQLFEAIGWLRVLLYGWICRLIEARAPRSITARRLRNRRLFGRLRTHYLRAGLYRRKGNPVARLLAQRGLLACLEQAGSDHPTPRYLAAHERWRLTVDEQTRALTQAFCDRHPTPADEQAEASRETIHELIQYLVERSETKQRGRERRLLFDLFSSYDKLQLRYKTADFSGWIFSLFRRPLVQSLPFHGRLSAIKFLRKSEVRIRQLKIQQTDQERYLAPLAAIQTAYANQLREDLRPIIAGAFEQVGMRPSSTREQVSLDKLQEEIHDQILARGHFHFSYLRDVISRNDLRMPDLTLDQLRSDPLLELDRLFRRQLLGVYTRGQVYLLGLQRASALLFGTAVGRLLTRFILLPVLGAYIILEGLDHTVGLLISAFSGLRIHFAAPAALLGVALFLLALINFRQTREACGKLLGIVGSLIGSVFDLTRGLLKTPVLGWIQGWIIAPLLLGGLFAGLGLLLYQEIYRGFGEPGETLFLLTPSAVPTGIALLVAGYALATLLLHTYPGRAMRDWLNHLVADTAVRLKKTILGGMLGAVVQGFSTVLHTLEHCQYTVENRLRSQASEGRLAFAGKALLGLLWFWVSYVATIYIVLLIEPQINPIKHFPVAHAADTDWTVAGDDTPVRAGLRQPAADWNDRIPAAGPLRLHGLGAEGELETLPRQPGPIRRARAGRQPWREPAATTAARVPLRYDSQTAGKDPRGRAAGPRLRRLGQGDQAKAQAAPRRAEHPELRRARADPADAPRAALLRTPDARPLRPRADRHQQDRDPDPVRRHGRSAVRADDHLRGRLQLDHRLRFFRAARLR